MLDIFKNKRVLGGVALVAVLFLGYYLWSGAGSDTPLLSDSQGASPLSQELLATLSKLHTIKLDPAVFSDPVFVSLTDFGVTIPPEASGRRNPFAPIGVGNLSQPATTTGTGR